MTQFEPNSDAAHNNIGVEYQALGWPILAVSAYKKAADGHNSLAMANLAYLYMEAGFSDEAEAELLRGNKETKPHDNIVAAAAELNRKREDERTRSEGLLTNAKRQQEFLRLFASVATEASAFVWSIDGPWGSNEVGEPISILFDAAYSRLNISWTESGKSYRFNGVSPTRVIDGRVEEQNPWGWSGDAKAFAIASLDCARIELMVIHEHKAVFRTFERLVSKPVASLAGQSA